MYPRLLSSGKPRETGATRICYSRETILALNPNRERNGIGTGTAGSRARKPLRSRVLARLVSLAHMVELAPRLC